MKKVIYKRIRGRPVNLKPMTRSEVQSLKTGDQVYIWWAQNGDLSDVRIDEVCTVGEITKQPSGKLIHLAGDHLFLWDLDVEVLPDVNHISWNGRGPAYFYYPPN